MQLSIYVVRHFKAPHFPTLFEYDALEYF